CSSTNVGPLAVGPESTTKVLPRLGSSTMRPCGSRPTGATSGSLNDGTGKAALSGPRTASIMLTGLGKPDAVVAEPPEMASRETSRDTLRRNMRGRTMSGAVSGRENASEASWAIGLCSSRAQQGTRVVGYSILLNPLPETRGLEPDRLPVASRI